MEGLAGSEKYVLWMLAYHHNDDTDQCDPSYSRLERETCLTRRTIIDIVKSLETKGLITVKRKTTHVNQYDLLFLVQPVHQSGELVKSTQATSEVTSPEHREHSSSVDPDTGEILTALKEGESEGEKTLRKRRTELPQAQQSPELVAAIHTWREAGYGEPSIRATTRLKSLIAEHEIALVLEAITKADAQNIANPLAWMERAIPGWKRERARGLQPTKPDAPTRTQSRYDHLIRR